MLKVKQFEFSVFGVNTYLLIDEETKQAAVIDPAMQTPQEEKRFDEYVESNNAKITQLINTHLHLDHCFGENYVKDKYGVPVSAHIDDQPLGQNMIWQYSKFGMDGTGKEVMIDCELKDGDIIKVGSQELQVIHVPGHSAGGIALYYPQGKLLFSGDSLFRRSIGRTDLLGGNHTQLIQSIKSKLLNLPDDTTVLPGHNGPTTIGEEKKFNPFL